MHASNFVHPMLCLSLSKSKSSKTTGSSRVVELVTLQSSPVQVIFTLPSISRLFLNYNLFGAKDCICAGSGSTSTQQSKARTSSRADKTLQMQALPDQDSVKTGQSAPASEGLPANGRSHTEPGAALEQNDSSVNSSALSDALHEVLKSGKRTFAQLQQDAEDFSRSAFNASLSSQQTRGPKGQEAFNASLRVNPGISRQEDEDNTSEPPDLSPGRIYTGEAKSASDIKVT